jgi:steroid Delta-isomerase
VTHDEIKETLDRYGRAFGDKDLPGLLALFREDAVQADPVNVPANVGHEAIATFFTNAFNACSSCSWEALTLHTCGDHAGVDFRVTVTTADGSMTIEGVEVFDFDEQGLINTVSAYWGDADVGFVAA